jgi:hypothetical protein
MSESLTVRLSTGERRRKPGEVWITDMRRCGEVPETVYASGGHHAWSLFPFLILTDSPRLPRRTHDGVTRLVGCFALFCERSMALFILCVGRRGLIELESHQLLGGD